LFLLFFLFLQEKAMFESLNSKKVKIEFVQLLRGFNPKSFLVWDEWFRATTPLYEVTAHESCFTFRIRGKLWFSVNDHVPEDFDEEQEFLVELWRGSGDYTACRQDGEGWVGLL